MPRAYEQRRPSKVKPKSNQVALLHPHEGPRGRSREAGECSRRGRSGVAGRPCPSAFLHLSLPRHSLDLLVSRAEQLKLITGLAPQTAGGRSYHTRERGGEAEAVRLENLTVTSRGPDSSHVSDKHFFLPGLPRGPATPFLHSLQWASSPHPPPLPNL